MPKILFKMPLHMTLLICSCATNSISFLAFDGVTTKQDGKPFILDVVRRAEQLLANNRYSLFIYFVIIIFYL